MPDARRDRPHVTLSVAMSLDGYIDHAGPDRLVLSNAEDLDRVDALRAESDAILVGAGTIRRDDPRLRVRSAARRRERLAYGRSEQPLRLTVSRGGALDPESAFFAAGAGVPVVYVTTGALAGARNLPAEVVGAGDPVDLAVLLADAAGRGVRRLLVEGGSAVHTWFLASGAVDRLRVAIAPIILGDGRAPRFLRDGTFPPLRVVHNERLGDVIVVHYECERKERP